MNKHSDEALDKITHYADTLRLKASMAYTRQGIDEVPYKETIVTNESMQGLSGDYYLVNEVMIFNGGSLKDSAYQVYSFDKEGNLLKMEDVCTLGKEFFRTMKKIKVLNG